VKQAAQKAADSESNQLFPSGPLPENCVKYQHWNFPKPAEAQKR